MNWLNALRARFTKASAVARHISFGFQGGPVWTERRMDLLAREAYLKNAIAYACVNYIARSVSQAPLLVYEVASDGSRRELPDHPVTHLLGRPNPTQSRAQIMQEIASHLAITGNAYIEGVGPETGARRGEFLELWTKRPDRMKVVPGEQGVAAYTHEVNGQGFRWDVDPITQRAAIRHLKLFHPLDDWYGLSPIEVAAMDVDGHNEVRAWNQALLQNSARPSGALSTERRLTDTQFARLKGEIAEKYSGAQNAGRPLLLEDGLQWQQFSFSPKDIEHLESKNTAARDICIAFGVPPMLLGIPGDNTYSNYREARLAFHDDTANFYLTAITGALGSWLLPDDGRYELGWNEDAIPATAYRREQLFDRAERSDFLSVDEKRELAGYGKLPDGKGEVVLVPSTDRPLEHAMIPPPDPVEVATATAAARAVTAPAPAGPSGAPKKPAATNDAKPTPRRAANDKSHIVEALRQAPDTLKAARAELACGRAEFALWLVMEKGLDDEAAAELAALTGD